MTRQEAILEHNLTRTKSCVYMLHTLSFRKTRKNQLHSGRISSFHSKSLYSPCSGDVNQIHRLFWCKPLNMYYKSSLKRIIIYSLRCTAYIFAPPFKNCTSVSEKHDYSHIFENHVYLVEISASVDILYSFGK